MTVRTKFLVLSLALVVVVLAPVAASLYSTQIAKQDAVVVNAAGRQRMLSQRIAKEML